MLSRRIVARWARTMRSAMNWAIAAVGLPPRSMSCSAAVRMRRRDLVFLVPLGDLGVEVPAVVVEPRRFGERLDRVQVTLLELGEADRDVGDLHTGVVDVVLNFHATAKVAKEPAEGVSERGVSEVADVSCLVRVDGSVLDDFLFASGEAGGRRPKPLGEPRGSFEEKVDVAVGSRLDARHAVDLTEGPDDFLRDDARRFSQPSRQLERQRYREVAERPLWWCLDRDHRERRIVGRNLIQVLDRVEHPGANPLMDGENHRLTSVIRFPLVARVIAARPTRTLARSSSCGVSTVTNISPSRSHVVSSSETISPTRKSSPRVCPALRFATEHASVEPA